MQYSLSLYKTEMKLMRHAANANYFVKTFKSEFRDFASWKDTNNFWKKKSAAVTVMDTYLEPQWEMIPTIE